MAIDFEKVGKRMSQLRWRPMLIIVGAGFVVSSIASTLITFQLMPSFESKDTSRDVDSAGFELSSKQTLSESDLQVIYDRNIFNKEGELGDVEPLKDDDRSLAGGAEAIKSDLPVKVLGIIYGGTPYNGLATMQDTQKNKINSFVVGDILLKEAQIIEIHRRRVILLRNERREYLELEKKEIVRTRRQKKGELGPSKPAGISPIAKGPALPNFEEEGFSRKGTDMIMSETYKQKLLTQDFTKVLQDAKATPNVVNGQVRGFKLTRIREDSIYQKAGLQNNDVVEEINGVPLTNPAGAIRLLQSLRNEREIEVLVNRGGSVFTMNLQVQ